MKSRWVLCVFMLAASVTVTAATNDCPGCNYKGKDLTGSNFANANLKGAHFDNATLTNATFDGADLTNATLTGAKFDGASFSNTTLKNADFSNATSFSKTNFQFAALDCAKFNTDITAATFSRLNITSPPPSGGCRTSFAGATMSCQFVSQWKDLDLTGANISACISQMQGVDFSNTVMPNVVFSTYAQQANLSNTKWSGANLLGAVFSAATLTQASFDSGVQLSGTDFTYVSAQNAVFDGANLSAQQSVKNPLPAAHFSFAYLAGASFKNASMQYADFTGVDFTGTASDAFTSADLTGARFRNANLSSATLSGTLTAVGADFGNANLTNANLKNLQLQPNSFVGCASGSSIGNASTIQTANLAGAQLCGAILDGVNLSCVDLTGAYVSTSTLSMPGPNGSTVSCGSTSLVKPIMTGVSASKVTSCFTTCPDGTPGPCSSAQWSSGGSPTSIPCCTAPAGQWCAPRKAANGSCSKDCDCAVGLRCVAGSCH